MFLKKCNCQYIILHLFLFFAFTSKALFETLISLFSNKKSKRNFKLLIGYMQKRIIIQKKKKKVCEKGYCVKFFLKELLCYYTLYYRLKCLLPQKLFWKLYFFSSQRKTKKTIHFVHNIFHFFLLFFFLRYNLCMRLLFI